MPLRRLVLASAVAALSAFSFAAQAQAPIVIKFSHVVAPDTPKGKGAQRFKELAEQRTNGRVKVEVYPNSQLYKDKEEMEALQLGSVQMLAPSLAKFGPLGVKEFEVFDLPFLFKDTDAFRAVTDGPLGADLFKKLEPKGIKGLAYWDNGFHIMSANKPLHNVADFKGLKMRIQSSKVLDAQMRALGAIPQVMAFSELYQALQTGVVDGTEGVPSNFYTQKIFEVQKHMTLSNHGHLAYAVIVNKKFWDGLPADIRTQLEGAIKDATIYANAIASTENGRALEGIKASGRVSVYTPTAAETNEWKKALMPVHKEMEGRVGKATIEAAYKAASFVAPKQSATPCALRTPLKGALPAAWQWQSPSSRNRSAKANNGLEKLMFNKMLDHLEEWLISFLMAAATLIIFVAVVHRYLAGVPYIQDYALKLDLSWAQTLCTILFVWMCKFGAAYGVRTGIHVGVDVVINRMAPKNRGRFVIFGLSAGAFFTGVIAVLGAVFVWKNGAHYAFLDLIGQPNDEVPEGPTDPDLEWHTWIIYLAIPLGSALMSYRFIQVCVAFWKTGELPKHDESHVQGIEEQAPLHVEEENRK